MIRLLLFSCIFIKCSLPKAPGKKIITKTNLVGGTQIKHHHLNNKIQNKNVLLAIFDPMGQKKFGKLLERKYKKKIRIEKVMYWHIVERMKNIYGNIVHLPASNFSIKTLEKGFQYIEKLKKPYDVFLLVHGFPNRLIGSPLVSKCKIGDTIDRDCIFENRFEITYKDIQSLENLDHIQNVFLQSCYGSTLSKEFLEVGAKSIISFQDKHVNFFYFDLFLTEYSKSKLDFRKTYYKIEEDYRKKISKSNFYKKIIKSIGFKSTEEYLKTIQDPSLSYLEKTRE